MASIDYASRYDDLVVKLLGRRLHLSDGLPESQIRQAETELGLRLPEALREYYRAAGSLSELNRAHNVLYDPDELIVSDGYLVFMEENQAVVHWGLRLRDLSESDPHVWQRVKARPVKWFPEEVSFSAFLDRMYGWQAGIEDGDE